MAVPDFAQGVTGTIFPMVGRPVSPATKTAAATSPAAGAAQSAQTASFTFDDFLDIVNPLQHIPVVSTLYRAVTGDQIGDPEKLAGDTLYGGPMGFAGSLADLAFKGLTGKDVGDTVLAMVTGDDSIGNSTAVAANTAQKPTAAPARIASQQPLSITTPTALAQPSTVMAQSAGSPDLAALQSAIRRNGINADLGLRATMAYQKSLDANAAIVPSN